ncbi:hypothetical protein NECAME_15767 [Necator americanus]|uniref:Uncharacterized protein n=1 Tax=Necator americanus TaxID=51031 RepID=W2SI32_NECAM|nr:hypothetical protein NECAME_15767 [Necator americanus]ETN68541.1 hypothetical protein NECAME_15767 [Necator americanus]
MLLNQTGLGLVVYFWLLIFLDGLLARLMGTTKGHIHYSREDRMIKRSFISLLAAAIVSIGGASSSRFFSKELLTGKMGLLSPPGNSDFEGCMDNTFDNAQIAFNIKLGIDPTLTWKNATELAEQVHVLIDKSVDSFVQTGWTQCEKERIGFAYDCPGLSC